MDEMVRPVSFTSLTTGLGFLSFLAAPIEPVQVFGLFAALGIGFCWLCSLVAVPAALALLGPERIRRPVARRKTGDAAWLRGVAALVARPRATLRGVLVVTAALSLGTCGLRVQDSWIDGFARNSDFRRATERVEEHLHGTHILLVHLTFDGDEPLRTAASLRAIGDFEAFLSGQPGVGGVLGAHSHVATVNHLFWARQPGSYRVPDDARELTGVMHQFDRVRGKQRRAEVIHDDRRRTLVTVYLKQANYRDTAELMDSIRAYAEERLEPLGAEVAFAGDIAVSQAMIPAIVNTQLRSIALAFLGAFGAVALLLRSARRALVALLPTAVAVVWVFGLMGWLDIAIGVATSTFCAITFGIGVDFAIHFLERVHRAGPDTRGGRDGGLGRVVQGLREAGPAIGADALAVALGFGVLGFSQVPANARLGLLVAASLLAATVLTLVGLGALLACGPEALRGGKPAGSRDTLADVAG